MISYTRPSTTLTKRRPGNEAIQYMYMYKKTCTNTTYKKSLYKEYQVAITLQQPDYNVVTTHLQGCSNPGSPYKLYNVHVLTHFILMSNGGVTDDDADVVLIPLSMGGVG